MHELLWEGVGMLAATLTTLAFLPQAVKTWRSGSAEDLSLGMFTLMVLGVILWLLYGIHLHNRPIIIANSVTLCLAGSILYFKLFRS